MTNSADNMAPHRHHRVPENFARPELPKLERTAAFIANFPQGPILQPTLITSLDHLGDVFGAAAADLHEAQGLPLWFGAGGQRALVVRPSTVMPSRGSDYVLGLNALAVSELPWHFLCLTTVDHLHDREFLIVASHARGLCARLHRYAEIYDPRKLLVGAPS